MRWITSPLYMRGKVTGWMTQLRDRCCASSVHLKSMKITTVGASPRNYAEEPNKKLRLTENRSIGLTLLFGTITSRSKALHAQQVEFFLLDAPGLGDHLV